MNSILAQKYGIVLSENVRREHRGSDEGRSQVRKFSDDQPNSSVYSGRIFPSGDFSIGIIPKKKIAPRDKEYEANHGCIEQRQVTWEEEGETYLQKYVVGFATSPPAPNLVNPAKFTQPTRKLYGQGGITTYGKRMVASAAVILQEEWGLRCTGFGTLTLSPMSAQNEAHVCADWSKIVNRFFEELRRHQRRHGVDERYVQVTEIQEKRWAETGSLGLHIHFLYKARKHAYSKDWHVCADWCRDTWRRILANSLGMSAHEVPKPRCELAIVKKSASGYLGKYLSKGGKILEDIKAKSDGSLSLPRSWWGISNVLRDTLKKRIVSLDSRSASDFWAWITHEGSHCAAYTRLVTIETDAFKERVVGIFGRIKMDSVKYCCARLDRFLVRNAE